MFLDAAYCKARVDHQVVSQAVVVAIGVRADGTVKSSAWTSEIARTEIHHVAGRDHEEVTPWQTIRRQ